MTEKCFAKCISKPGAALDSSEQVRCLLGVIGILYIDWRFHLVLETIGHCADCCGSTFKICNKDIFQTIQLLHYPAKISMFPCHES